MSFGELVEAVTAEREEFWARKSYEIAWHVNSQPTFGRRRQVIQPNRINPLMQRQRRGMALTTDNEAAAATLNAWAARAKAKREQRSS